MKYDWQKNSDGIPTVTIGNITLCVCPERYKFGKPARGTKWRALCNHWDANTRTVSRFGRDEYSTLHDTIKSAMNAAEKIYEDALV